MDVFKELPHEFIPVEDLSKVVNDKSKSIHRNQKGKKKGWLTLFIFILYSLDPRLNKVYATHLHSKDYLEQKKNGEAMISFEHYLENPKEYHSKFHEKVIFYYIYIKDSEWRWPFIDLFF